MATGWIVILMVVALVGILYSIKSLRRRNSYSSLVVLILGIVVMVSVATYIKVGEPTVVRYDGYEVDGEKRDADVQKLDAEVTKLFTFPAETTSDDLYNLIMRHRGDSTWNQEVTARLWDAASALHSAKLAPEATTTVTPSTDTTDTGEEEGSQNKPKPKKTVKRKRSLKEIAADMRGGQ